MTRLTYITPVFALTAFTALQMNADGLTPVLEKSPMKALTIHTTELIDEAPPGLTVNELVRDGWSCYFEGGDQYRSMYKGMQGEYVVGDDGNIYLRYACASISHYLDTYLMLEPVDETTYVAHTPQLIWAEETDDGLFTAYATRLVHEKLGANSFTYSLDMDGSNVNTDIYFTYENGNLRQKDLGTIEMNEEIFPHEIIGFTTSTGGWIGFGDGLVTLETPGEDAPALPAGAEVRDMSMSFSSIYYTGDVDLNGVATKAAEAGDSFYLLNPASSGESWMKGDIDRTAGTVTFKTQYLGMNPDLKCVMWLQPAVYENYEERYEDSDLYEWFRRHMASSELVFSYDGSTLTCAPNQTLYISRDREGLDPVATFDEPVVRPYENASGIPANPEYVRITEWDDFWEMGRVIFTLPCLDTEGLCIPSDELSYAIYSNNENTPYTLTTEIYPNLQEEMTLVPYDFVSGYEITYSDLYHTLYFYEYMEKIGIQTVRIHNGEETRSDIVWADTSAIEEIKAAKENGYGKYVENGRIVIVHDGRKYNTLGLPVK